LEQAQRIRNVVGPPLGASARDVTLVDLQGATYPAGTEESSQVPSYELYASTQHEFERLYKDKIQSALGFVPGAMVTVNVELHAEVEDSAQSVKIDPKAKTDDRSPDRDHPHAPASLDILRKIEFGGANSPAAIDLSNADGYETRHVKRAGLTPKRVTVSVAVPGAYFAQVWRDQNGKSLSAEPKRDELASIEQEIRTKIEQHVARVVPVPEGQDRQLASLVTVTAFPQMPTAPQSEPTASDAALTWVNNHSGLVVAVVSCFLGLLMLRSIVRSAIRTTEVENAPQRRGDFDEPHDLPRAPAYERSRRRSSTATGVRDELSEIVRDDPNAAASVLRGWIGSAN
jgi:flagellar M-ring protein FliF